MATSRSVKKQSPADESHDEEHGDARQQRLQPSTGATGGGGLGGQVLLLAPPPRDRPLQELSFRCRQCRLPGGDPFLGRAETAAAVQLTVVTAGSLPLGRGAGQVQERPLTFPILVEPRSQPRPRPPQRLVRHLDGIGIGGEQPGVEQGVEHRVVRSVMNEIGPTKTVADRRSRVGQGDQAKEQRARDLPSLG